MTNHILELAKYLDIRDETVSVSYDGSAIGAVLAGGVDLPLGKSYRMINQTGSLSSYSYLMKDPLTYMLKVSMDGSAWSTIGSDQTITAIGACTLSVRTFDLLGALGKIGGTLAFKLKPIVQQNLSGVTTLTSAAIGAGIIEQGRAADGVSWIKYSNGYMEVWSGLTQTLQDTTTSDCAVITLPVSFAAGNFPFCSYTVSSWIGHNSALLNFGNCVSKAQALSPNTFQYYNKTDVAHTDGFFYGWRASGWWKLPS